MNPPQRIYLDNAATSWPKPGVVYDAVDHYQRNVGAPAGRAAYSDAQAAQRTVDNARAACAELLGVSDPRQIVFTSNGTDALNLALHGLLGPGDHVIATVCDHNSVLRPLQAQAEVNQVDTTYVGCDADGYVDPDDIRSALQSNTRLVTLSHASNVTGALQSVDEITRIAHEGEALVLLDAAQTAGHLPIDVQRLEVDLLATGGHKGLLGPLGTGLLMVRPGVEDRLKTIRQGGTGTQSQSDSQPAAMPERFEVGNLNVPALAGLAAAAQFLRQPSGTEIQGHVQQLTRRLIEGLQSIEEIRVYGPSAESERVGVVSIAVRDFDPQEFAAALDASSQIQCRAGLHCAPRMHAALQTDRLGGLVRFSPGWATTPEQIETTLQTIEAVASTVAKR